MRLVLKASVSAPSLGGTPAAIMAERKGAYSAAMCAV
jgi:hypothetical protein